MRSRTRDAAPGSSLSDVADAVHAAVCRRDVDAFVRLHEDSVEVVGPGGPLPSGQSGLVRLFGALSRFDFAPAKSEILGSTLIEEGTYAVSGTMSAEPVGRYASVLTVRKGLINAHALHIDDSYAGRPPWDIDGPQQAFVELAQSGEIRGRVLDVGCGTGENALFLSSSGYEVVGVDASHLAIEKARAKAAERRLGARFLYGDARDLVALGDSFDTSIDSGLMHVMGPNDRALLVGGLSGVVRAGGRHHLMCLSHRATIQGPYRFSPDEIQHLFNGWALERAVESRFMLRAEAGLPESAAASTLFTLRHR